jgi:hypothetical protein
MSWGAATQHSTSDRASSCEAITRTSRVWLDDEGILHELLAPGTEQVLADACENLAADATVARGTRPPLLVDMSQVRSINRQARTYYTTEGPKVVCAVALVVGSPLSRMLGNFFIGFQKPPIPLRLFSTTADAAAWLRRFLPAGSDAKGGTT